MKQGWRLEDICWSAFRPDRVEPGTVRIIRTAAIVEHNAPDYVRYLKGVFAGEPAMQEAVTAWGAEEAQHGRALARWAACADPGFDFERRFAHFRASYRIPVTAQESVRGSRAGEMLARCVVESGTWSYYTAIADKTEEPVLEQICRHIAADEMRHYKLFYGAFRRFEAELPSRLSRVRIVLGRISEAEDDELACAYHAANARDLSAAYDRRQCVRAYKRHALPFYQRGHVARAMAMVAKPVGFRPHGLPVRAMTVLAWSAARYHHLASRGQKAA